MTIPAKIVKPIVAVGVVQPPPKPEGDDIVVMPPLLRRPDALEGATYKIKTPQFDHALYVTINDIVVDGQRRPFEIFINSKCMEHFAWIVALTRVLSAIFRNRGDVVFLVDELRSVFDPRGGYYKPGGRYMPSLVAEIGECIERHLIKIGILESPEVPPELAAKRKAAREQGLSGGSQCPNPCLTLEREKQPFFPLFSHHITLNSKGLHFQNQNVVP